MASSSTKHPRVRVVIQWAEARIGDPVNLAEGKTLTVEEFDRLAEISAEDTPKDGGANKIKLNVLVDGEERLEMRHDATYRRQEGRGLRDMIDRRLRFAQRELAKVANGIEPEQRHHSWFKGAVPYYREILSALGPRSADSTPRPKATTQSKKKPTKKRAPKKPSRQEDTAKATAKKTAKKAAKKAPAKKRARAKDEDEIRLLKRSGKLIATYGVTYKLTKAMEDIRDCARRSKPCKIKIVIRAYDQLRNAAKSPGKSPRQGLAYYIAAELAKDLRRSAELVAVGKGDHPRIKEA